MTEILSSLSDGLAGAVEAASPSVVRVEAGRRGAGSGVVLDADGLIVTNAHMVP